MRHHAWITVLLLCTLVAQAQEIVGDASVTAPKPQVSEHPQGKRIVQDVALATSAASYTLRYDIVELPDDPQKVAFQMWAPTLGYTPLGIAGPSMANWYNQGFFIWTFDGLNIQDYRAEFRVVREYGQDAMVEWVWDTPKAKVTARFAITSGSDKLLFFGSYEPKEEIKDVRLRLMAYPATFSKPWTRSATTALRTLTTGSGVALDLEKERWVLLEDTLEGRAGAGSAGLLLGDVSAFSKVTLDGIGGYAEYVNLTLRPDRREFALGFYELPSLPDYQETRAYFRRIADTESDALAKLLHSDLDKPLTPLPVDPERAEKIAQRDEERLKRPAETWRPDPRPLAFPWASRLPGPPVKVALLCARWSAYETMELARRLEMDVEHQYFDSSGAIAQPSAWPYRNQTGIGSLGAGVAERNAVRICSDEERDVILIANLNGSAIPARLRSVILKAVREGKGLMLTGGSALGGWPKELTVEPDESLAQQALAYLPWSHVPGLREGERGRIGTNPLLRGFRYGSGRVLVLTANISRYSALVALNDASEGLEGATDRLLAFSALAMLSAAGRDMPAQITIQTPEEPVPAGRPVTLTAQVRGEGIADALVRVQDDHDTVLARHAQGLDPADACIILPPLPAGREYFVDVILWDKEQNCLGYAGAFLQVEPEHRIEALRLSPSKLVHEAAVPMVDLADGGKLRCEAEITPAPGDEALRMRWEVRDSFGRALATATSPVSGLGVARVELALQRPVTVCHQLDTALLGGERVLAVRRDRFTIPIPYPYDGFTFLMWSFARGETVTRRVQRACYDLGADMMDICHMRGYTDESAAREYAVAARSGLRLVPYVTRIAMNAAEDNTLKPGLFNEEWIESERVSMEACCRQAAPYKPAAYTLGDENYMCRGNYEVDVSPESVAGFRRWLKDRYKTVEALNEVWRSEYADFEEIEEPMLLEEAATQDESFAAWFDFRDFMDTAFAQLHERLAGFVRKEDPGAKVGWDGFLSYHWQAGYDFYKLTRNLELNQVYTSHAFQTELVRSFKRPDALTGEWGNAIADKEDGFSAIGWHNLFKGHNSCWWWVSWGCDYIPFNPDMSASKMGEWFFKAADEIRAGPGKLLVHAKRDHSGIAVLYSQADMYASVLADKVCKGSAFAGTRNWRDDHTGLTRIIEDLGYQYRHVAGAELEADPQALAEYRVLFLPFASCLSDRQVAAIREFVNGGGMVIADGRVGLLGGNGVIREERPLDDVFGVESPAGIDAFSQGSLDVEIEIPRQVLSTQVLEPKVELTTGASPVSADGAPVHITNDFGEGRAVLVNLPFHLTNSLRAKKEEGPVVVLVGKLLYEFGLRPYSELMVNGSEARRIKQSLFVEGDLRYLCLEQDILLRGMAGQKAKLTMQDPAFVYDARAGRQIAEGQVSSWDVELSRGNPRLFALLPYRVTGVEANVPAEVKPGETLGVSVSVNVDPGEAQFHVVHVSVYAPGSEKPHRHYSQSIECPGGKGEGTIPFALNDAEGVWGLEFKDAASGVKATRKVRVGT